MLRLIIGHTDQPSDDAHALLQIDCGKNKRDKLLETSLRYLHVGSRNKHSTARCFTPF